VVGVTAVSSFQCFDTVASTAGRAFACNKPTSKQPTYFVTSRGRKIKGHWLTEFRLENGNYNCVYRVYV